MPRDASELALPPRPRCGGGLPPLSVQRAAPGALLDRGRHPQRARPVDVRAAERTGLRSRRLPGTGPTQHSGEHGDLLDAIRESCGFIHFREAADEARRFLSLPRAEPSASPHARPVRLARGRAAADRHVDGRSAGRSSRRISAIAASGPFTMRARCGFIRRCWYRPEDGSPTETRPAMIAAVTDLSGAVTGAHRTWLAPDGLGKAPVDTPRRAMGNLLGHAVRFGVAGDVLAVGEGIETMLTLRLALPAMPMAAALSANHLAAVLLPMTLRRLYIARDADEAGDQGARGVERTRRGGRHRGAGAVSADGRFQRRSPCIRPRCASGGAARPARAGG